MKNLFTLLAAFFIAQSAFAAAPAKDEKCGPATTTESCTGAEAQKDEHQGYGYHDALTIKMRSLFPEKQQDKSNSARPEKTEIVSPTFMASVATGPIKLEWKEVSGATNYHVQVATDPHFKWLVANEHFVKTNSYEFTKAEAGQKYFWRVASFKSTNKSSYNKSRFVSSSFSVK